jgi:hypothetical protein
VRHEAVRSRVEVKDHTAGSSQRLDSRGPVIEQHAVLTRASASSLPPLMRCEPACTWGQPVSADSLADVAVIDQLWGAVPTPAPSHRAVMSWRRDDRTATRQASWGHVAAPGSSSRRASRRPHRRELTSIDATDSRPRPATAQGPVPKAMGSGLRSSCAGREITDDVDDQVCARQLLSFEVEVDFTVGRHRGDNQIRDALTFLKVDV